MMNTNNPANYLYLIQTVEDNKIQLATSVTTVDGVVLSEGKSALC